MICSSLNALLPSMLDEFSMLAFNSNARPTEAQTDRLKALKVGAENTACVAELGLSAVGAAIGACAGELDEAHLRNLGWLVELLGELSAGAHHIQHEATTYLRMANQ